MAAAESPPFLRPHPDQIQAGPWLVRDSGGWEGLGPTIENWDYATVLSLRRQLVFDPDEVSRASDSGPELRLAWVVTAESTSTRIRQRVFQGPAPAVDGIITFEIPPETMGGRMRLRTQLIVSQPDPASDLSPKRIGSFIWQDQTDAVLEGDAARFPIQVVDFSAAGLPEKAAWRIEIDGEDLELPATAAVTVKINRGHSAAYEMALRPTATDTSLLLDAALRFDVARRMLRLLADCDVAPETIFPAGSLGEALLMLLNAHLPYEDPQTLRQALRIDSGRLEASLQAALAVYSEA